MCYSFKLHVNVQILYTYACIYKLFLTVYTYVANIYIASYVRMYALYVNVCTCILYVCVIECRGSVTTLFVNRHVLAVIGIPGDS